MKDLILPYQQTKKMKERNISSKRPSSHFQAARGLTVSVPTYACTTPCLLFFALEFIQNKPTPPKLLCYDQLDMRM
jgi:hypothetical protein